MRFSLRRFLLLVATLGLVPTVATAEGKKADSKDPNRIICEKQGVLGSRLAVKRVCMTAAEWEVRKREDRQAIEKGQLQASAPSGN